MDPLITNLGDLEGLLSKFTWLQAAASSLPLVNLRPNPRPCATVPWFWRRVFDQKGMAKTWRGEREEHFTTDGGHKVFLSGGSPGKRGVGICIARKLLDKIDGVLIFSYSDRVL